MRQNALLLFLLFILLISCDKDDKVVITISQTEIAIAGNGGCAIVSFESNMDWLAESSQGWCIVAPKNGEAHANSITITVAANDSRSERNCIVSITAGKTTETITVVQKGYEPGVYWVNKMGLLGKILNKEQKDTITTLVLRGEINKDDFDVMKRQMPNLQHIDLSGVKCEDDKIPDEAFGGLFYANIKITTIILPDVLKTIGNSAFTNCIGLTGSLVLPNGLIEIGNSAFKNCSRITGTLKLPKTLTEIGEAAFMECIGLTGSLIIPDRVASIGIAAFMDCAGFDGPLTLSENLSTIGDFVFYDCSGLAGSLIIPDRVTSIGFGAFSYCSGFTGSLSLPDGLLAIGSYAFSNCTGFNGSLKLPTGLEIIGGGAFENCSAFSGSLIIPDKLEEIASKSFYNCSGFTKLVLGKSITLIYDAAFYNCKNISDKVVFPLSLSSIKNGGFRGCDKIDAFKFPHIAPFEYTHNMLPIGATIEVPAKVVESYKSTCGWEVHNIEGY